MSNELCGWRGALLRLPFLVLAAIAPVVFPLSQLGYGTLHELTLRAALPAAAVLVAGCVWLRYGGRANTAVLVLSGAISGALATLALEAVRYTGFRLGFMPGNLPDLMGVLLLDRFAFGPSTASTIAGFAYHFWNGTCFGIMFVLLRGGYSAWWAVPFGVLVGVGFLLSPVVQALGVGLFGVDFGWHFAATVLTAHLAFGVSLAFLNGSGKVLRVR